MWSVLNPETLTTSGLGVTHVRVMVMHIILECMFIQSLNQQSHTYEFLLPSVILYKLINIITSLEFCV